MIGSGTGNSSSKDTPKLAGVVGNGDISEVVVEQRDVEEPCIGLEFDSEEAAKTFYDAYAQRVGFKMRIDQCRRSEVDKKIISRRLSCNKGGYYTKSKNQFGQIKKLRTSSRQGCNAMMLVRVNKSGKWVVTRFEKEHTHPLLFSASLSLIEGDLKERTIEALTAELKHQDQLINFYRRHLNSFLRDLEQQTEVLSTKIQVAVNNIKDIERKHQ
ncbi:protein FAR1-RELATED SEQUENCE 3-like isoform X2 [Rutidosis leptorrhynchoides]|uniref:protein FAR1-RELATED SEQUENCE 3-like isoform X2 n=1 Tax=Rutidosis leptorrhynchoides TaxID=125765 RepID=UPI003A997905